MKQAAFWIGLSISILGAVLGQAELIGEPHRHYVTIAFIALTAANAYMLQTKPSWDGTERRNQQENTE